MSKPNILLLVIDSFRSDKFFGDKKTSVTPNLDKLTKEGIYFSQAISSAPASLDRKSTRLNSSHSQQSRMPSSA